MKLPHLCTLILFIFSKKSLSSHPTLYSVDDNQPLVYNWVSRSWPPVSQKTCWSSSRSWWPLIGGVSRDCPPSFLHPCYAVDACSPVKGIYLLEQVETLHTFVDTDKSDLAVSWLSKFFVWVSLFTWLHGVKLKAATFMSLLPWSWSRVNHGIVGLVVEPRQSFYCCAGHVAAKMKPYSTIF